MWSVGVWVADPSSQGVCIASCIRDAREIESGRAAGERPAPGTALICHLSLTDLVEGLRREVAVERVELVGLQSVGLHL